VGPVHEGRAQILLEVHDNGSGMDSQTQLRAFEPFFTTKFTGRGLGLAEALGIVGGHEGNVELDSSPGRGTTVRILLPAAEQAPAGLPAAPAAGGKATASQLGQRNGALSAKPKPASNLVLVVDDDPAVCSVARRALGRHGFQV